VVCACIELAPVPWRWRDVLPTPAHRLAATLPRDVRILDSSPRTSADFLVPRLMGRDLRFRTNEIGSWSEPGVGSTLAALGFTHVIYRRPAGAECATPDCTLSDGLSLVATFPEAALLKVEAAPAPVIVQQMTGFYDREASGKDSWLWMGDRGELVLVNGTPAPRRVTLGVELQAFAHERAIGVMFGGQRLPALTVGPARRWYEIGPIDVQPGATRLVLESAEGATRVDDVAHNGDTRAVSISLRTWKWTDLSGGIAG
jgi:hypothetical protein